MTLKSASRRRPWQRARSPAAATASLGVAGSDGRGGGDLGDQIGGYGVQIPGGGDAVDEADVQGFRGGKDAPSEQEIPGQSGAHQAGQTLGSAVVGEAVVSKAAGAEAGGVSSQAQVGGQGQFQAVGQGVAVEDGDYGHRQGGQGIGDAEGVQRLRQGLAASGGENRAGAGEGNHADVILQLQRRAAVPQPGGHGGVYGTAVGGRRRQPDGGLRFGSIAGVSDGAKPHSHGIGPASGGALWQRQDDKSPPAGWQGGRRMGEAALRGGVRKRACRPVPVDPLDPRPLLPGDCVMPGYEIAGVPLGQFASRLRRQAGAG